MSDKLITCNICGVIMVRLARDICPDCFRQEEAFFQEVKAFLKANPDVSMEEIAIHTSCNLAKVEVLIRSGRLERAGIKHVAHQCQLCQVIIYEGVVCGECKKTLKEQVNLLKVASSKKPE